ncbi:nicotinate-nucleotide adenylyltransferase [Nitrincola sp. A-D6]|uniref:nicotinate-nucleotide adenylyltransferase n=1 Tax=Nitrincola sp. A-D6 TaxID=1545442 RepID=UPI00051FAC22|nr:nicotinate-nucleotide adenylyltransferase [Nitrincola sp. A-D6]KGK41433.1 nicotinate-nucleotide adenylyltransferase [Nitrincola sp. A-D6]
MQINEPYVFMGGTFDPVHHGHLRTALEIQQWLQVSQVSLIPSGEPVHREQPGCSAEHRLAMVTLAVADAASLHVDEREVSSSEPSFSALTLTSLRNELGPQRPICMVMGMDAYLTLPQWKDWHTFLSLCHIIAVARPGYQYQPVAQMDEFTRLHAAESPLVLTEKPCGSVLIHELTPLGISATQIRELIGQGHSPRYLLPDQVWEYIKQHQLYSYKRGK